MHIGHMLESARVLLYNISNSQAPSCTASHAGSGGDGVLLRQGVLSHERRPEEEQ